LETLEWELIDVPAEMNFWNYSIAVTLPDGRIFISGGIKHDLKTIQSDAYIMNPGENTMSVVQLPNMNTVRYTHTSVYLNHFVYCMGGRTYGEVDSYHLEYFRNS
jgi:hypothetical protein